LNFLNPPFLKSCASATAVSSRFSSFGAKHSYYSQ
jgi:hypothetical protein